MFSNFQIHNPYRLTIIIHYIKLESTKSYVPKTVKIIVAVSVRYFSNTPEHVRRNKKNIDFCKNLERSMIHGREGKTYMEYLLYGYSYNL